MFLGLRIRNHYCEVRIILKSSKNRKKNLYLILTSVWHLSLKIFVNVALKRKEAKKLKLQASNNEHKSTDVLIGFYTCRDQDPHAIKNADLKAVPYQPRTVPSVKIYCVHCLFQFFRLI
jgi:hypothetical protein